MQTLSILAYSTDCKSTGRLEKDIRLVNSNMELGSSFARLSMTRAKVRDCSIQLYLLFAAHLPMLDTVLSPMHSQKSERHALLLKTPTQAMNNAYLMCR